MTNFYILDNNYQTEHRPDYAAEHVVVRGEDVPGPHLRHGVGLGRGGPRLGLALPGGLGLGGLEDGGRGGEAPGGRQQQLRVEQPSGELEHDDH